MNRKNIRSQIILIVCMIGCVALVLWTRPTILHEEPISDPETPRLEDDQFMRGSVVSVLHEEKKEEDMFGGGVLTQRLNILIQDGGEKGKTVEADYEIADRSGAEHQILRTGSPVVLGKHVSPDQTLYYVSDVYRLTALWIILGGFFLFTIIFGGLRGFMAFVGLGFSLFMVIAFVVPHILSGGNPFLICVIGTAIIACVSLYLAHGVSMRSTIALVSTLCTIVLALGVSLLCAGMAKLFGLGTEEAFYLQYAPIPPIDLRGLFLGAVIIGVLGILDDVTTAQTATVEEITKANPTLSFSEVYRRGTSVGREHITSLVNTLVLAYTGTSFPLLLLFIIYERPIWVTLNSELVMEELMRMLIGSIVLLFAVPLTTLLAASVFSRKRPVTE